MENSTKVVDDFRFLPPKLSAWIRTFIPDSFSGEIPFHPLAKPLKEARISLVSSAGISLKTDPAFDMQKEREDPTYGDPSYRVIPKGTTSEEIDVNHLHINRSYIIQDLNVMLPLDRMEELAADGVVGDLAPSSFSFYGFQWERDEFLEEAIQPMIDCMKAEAVDAALLTPA